MSYLAFMAAAGAAPTTTLLDFDEYAEDDVVSGVQHGITHTNILIGLTADVSGWSAASSPNRVYSDQVGLGIPKFEASSAITAASFNLAVVSSTFELKAYTAGGTLVDTHTVTAGALSLSFQSFTWTAGQNVQRLDFTGVDNGFTFDNLSITQI